LPDGLEGAALRLGLTTHARPQLQAPFEHAAWLSGPLGRLAPVAAGLVGTLLAAIVAWSAARGLSKLGDVSHR
jgi:phage-related minor tail protein